LGDVEGEWQEVNPTASTPLHPCYSKPITRDLLSVCLFKRTDLGDGWSVKIKMKVTWGSKNGRNVLQRRKRMNKTNRLQITP
jgi:hypothetical protein